MDPMRSQSFVLSLTTYSAILLTNSSFVVCALIKLHAWISKWDEDFSVSTADHFNALDALRKHYKVLTTTFHRTAYTKISCSHNYNLHII